MQIGDGGILLVGCGKMGGALLRGWLAAGLEPGQATVIDPHPGEWLEALRANGLRLNEPVAIPPDVVVVATKPQIMGEAVPGLMEFGNGGTLFVSIAAGTAIRTFEEMLGASTPVVRAMPNTPAAIGAGITALVQNAHTAPDQMVLAENLMQAVGHTIVLQSEEQMHAVTALSGSGPAYVFALVEALVEAGTREGLPQELATQLAVATVNGAGRMMMETAEDPGTLREQVTSPNGTTAAGLERLLAEERGLVTLISDTVAAASLRSRELAEA